MTKTRSYLFPILLPRKEMLITKGEAGICAEIASYLKAESLEGRLPYVWFHVANEYAGQYRPVYGAKQTTLGKISGIPDYAFLGKDGCFFIEVKTSVGKLKDNQIIVKQWCEDIGVPHYVCRSLDDVKCVLNESKKNAESLKLPSI